MNIGFWTDFLIAIPQVAAYLFLILQLYGRLDVNAWRIVLSSSLVAIFSALTFFAQIPFGIFETLNLFAAIASVRWLILPTWKESSIACLAVLGTMGVAEVSVISILPNALEHKIIFALSEALVFGSLAFFAKKHGFEIQHLKQNSDTKRTLLILIQVFAAVIFFMYPVPMEGYIKPEYLKEIGLMILSGTTTATFFLCREKSEENKESKYRRLIQLYIRPTCYDGLLNHSDGDEEIRQIATLNQTIPAFLLGWEWGIREIPLWMKEWAFSESLTKKENFYFFLLEVMKANPEAHTFICQWIKQNSVEVCYFRMDSDNKRYIHIIDPQTCKAQYCRVIDTEKEEIIPPIPFDTHDGEYYPDHDSEKEGKKACGENGAYHKD